MGYFEKLGFSARINPRTKKRQRHGHGGHNEKPEGPYKHSKPVLDWFVIPARGAALNRECTTPKGIVVTASKQNGNRCAEDEYKEITRHQ